MIVPASAAREIRLVAEFPTESWQFARMSGWFYRDLTTFEVVCPVTRGNKVSVLKPRRGAPWMRMEYTITSFRVERQIRWAPVANGPLPTPVP